MLRILFFLLTTLLPLRAELTGRKPNIIFIITDDQGYGDLSAHGNPILKTPNLDKLHSESVRFTDFHVSPTCAPTRSALLTGRHEFRNGITHTINERERLTPDAVTLAQVLKGAGYATGIFGKWHLGDEQAYWPTARGFDEMFIHGAGGIGQSYPGTCGDAPGNTYFNPTILHNGTFEKTSGYCTDVFFDRATKWIEATKGKQPLYAHIATNAPHAPYNARPEDAALYADKVDKPTAGFFGMIHNIDENVGRLMTKLGEWGIERDTLVIFMNDNGSAQGTKVFPAGMRGSKNTPWLGGTRAISLWRWAGTLTAGDRPQLTAHIDFFPTLAGLAGAKLDGKVNAQVEGRSLIPLLEKADADWPERTLFTHVGRWALHASPETGKYANCSVRTPRWHLVNIGPKAAWQLFDVQAEYGEQTNVAEAQPKVVAELSGAFEKWWTSVQPQLVNENAPVTGTNTFHDLYWKQFGGGPAKK